jgi:hypothetical protein
VQASAAAAIRFWEYILRAPTKSLGHILQLAIERLTISFLECQDH